MTDYILNDDGFNVIHKRRAVQIQNLVIHIHHTNTQQATAFINPAIPARQSSFHKQAGNRDCAAVSHANQ